MYRILIVSEDFVLRKAVAFSLNDLDACVECADTVSAMLVLHRESPFDLVIVMGTAAEMCRQEVMEALRTDKTRPTGMNCPARRGSRCTNRCFMSCARPAMSGF